MVLPRLRHSGYRTYTSLQRIISHSHIHTHIVYKLNVYVNVRVNNAYYAKNVKLIVATLFIIFVMYLFKWQRISHIFKASILFNWHSSVTLRLSTQKLKIKWTRLKFLKDGEKWSFRCHSMWLCLNFLFFLICTEIMIDIGYYLHHNLRLSCQLEGLNGSVQCSVESSLQLKSSSQYFCLDATHIDWHPERGRAVSVTVGWQVSHNILTKKYLRYL